MAFDNTDGVLYIVELRPPFQRVEIQFYPESIDDNAKGDFQSVGIVGRNHDRLQHTGGSNEIKLPIEFLSDDASREDVKEKVRFLQSLTMRDGNNGPARNVKLVFGDLFNDQIWVITDAPVKWSHFDRNANNLPIRAKMTLTMRLDPRTNLTISDWRNL